MICVYHNTTTTQWESKHRSIPSMYVAYVTMDPKQTLLAVTLASFQIPARVSLQVQWNQ